MKRRKNANAQVTDLRIMRLLCRACPLAEEFLWETDFGKPIPEKKKKKKTGNSRYYVVRMFDAKTVNIIAD
jgi:hypothetical protein